MPGVTPVYGLPYQEDGDAPAGSMLGADLAAAVEAQISRLDAARTALASRVSDLEAAFDDGDWETWTPALFGSSSGGSLGLATNHSRYKTYGKLCVAQLEFIFGSGTSFGTGVLEVSLPVAYRSENPAHIGSGLIIDASPSTRRSVVVQTAASNRMLLAVYDGILVGAATPWTWTTNDVVRASILYETA